MYFMIQQDRKTKWRWRLYNDNGELIVGSGKDYLYQDDCIHDVHLVMDTNRDTPIHGIE